jgi:hypothetical protein
MRFKLPFCRGPSVFRVVFSCIVFVFISYFHRAAYRKAPLHKHFCAVRYSTGRGSSGCESYFGSFFMDERLGNAILESRQVTAT